MHGSVLYPLNELKKTLPAVYQIQSKKYEGREWLFEKRISILNCLWNDVLHFSPIHPQIILDTWRKEGLYKDSETGEKEISAFKVPSELISDTSTVCFQSFNFDISSYDPKRDKFWAYESASYREQVEVHTDQIKIWVSDQANGRRLFWFSHTMHILAKQALDITSCEIVTAN